MACTPSANAAFDAVEDDGFYDVQYADGRTAGRAHLFSGPTGSTGSGRSRRRRTRSPTDGPVGGMLEATGRSPMRASEGA